MSDVFDYDVFLCFASRDIEHVRPIWQELSSSGLRVFWSDESLKENIGQSFFSVIQEALEKSRYFLLYCTPAAMDSQWVKEEYETFYSNFYIPSRQKRRFVILPGLGFESQSLPPMLRRIQLTDSTAKIISILGGQDFQALKRENEELKRALETAQAELGERDAANRRVEALQAELDATSADLDTARKQIKNFKARPARQERAQETVQQQSAEAQAPENLKQELDEIPLTRPAFEQAGPASKHQAKPSAQALPATHTNSIGMEFVLIPVGTFEMGSNEGKDEQPVHTVEITKPFYLGKYPVTQAEWKAVMRKNPSYHKGATRPVESVSWKDAQRFILKLEKYGDSGYRLPTEAEWEYACRAGEGDAYERDRDAVAWYDRNSGGEMHPVGEKQRNAWGLYDMLGNVWEWVQDRYDGDYYERSPRQDPQGPDSGEERVLRGGAFYDYVDYVRCSARVDGSPLFRNYLFGFRVVLLPTLNSEL